MVRSLRTCWEARLSIGWFWRNACFEALSKYRLAFYPKHLWNACS
jgi:hypothetical protein